ncbi:hypothetical protein DUZ99_08370 [Xylanibacillus composti]|uniref:DUF4309 domain-containing protein n=1 Tax=Xylanibacillus composti TaxID=1572762 RepID=A0A8J4M4W9_9BACL|nr:hypothetical protein [Xylanibacillus composti]MDT9725008.1 hypothetical protein [Xylanibacillus composti]GIQ71301.1 hypothetical protein XYCOK13_41250 [Xylanibacillus composti]
MKAYAIRFLLVAAIVVLPVAISGCKQAAPDPASLSAEENRPISDQPEEQPSPSADRPSKKETNGLEISSDQHQSTDAGLAANDGENLLPELEATDTLPQAPEEGTAPSKPLQQFTLTQPRLMGMTVGDSHEVVAQLHGQPKELATMADGEHKLSVHQYDGFMVGINEQQKIEFITVMSKQVDPGLNGFYIGSTAAKAVDALGEPTSENEYVLTYLGNGTMLKLDVDPVTNEVISARLFPEED